MNGVLLTSFSSIVRDAAVRAGRSSVPVLICGETGCGKTVLAKLIHQSSLRASKPFVRADCASIPDSLFEREMFGHTRGSFTDAKDSQPGLFEAADGGTLFLDEIGELPLTAQPKLLSVLDDSLVRRIGSTKSTHVNVRIIAATNRDLAGMVHTRQFRPDLYYRLGFLKISVPPLRERSSFIRELASHILQSLVAARMLDGRPVPEFHPETIARLQAYSWPGNIRELEQALTFAVTFFPSSVILPEHLPSEVAEAPARGATDRCCRATSPRYMAPDDRMAERSSVMQALEICHGNRTRAAKLLGMSRATLWIKLRQFGMELPAENGGSAERPALVKESA